MVCKQRALGLKVGPVGAKVGAKVGPVGMKVTPAGNLYLGIAQDLPCSKDQMRIDIVITICHHREG